MGQQLAKMGDEIQEQYGDQLDRMVAHMVNDIQSTGATINDTYRVFASVAKELVFVK